MEAPWTRRGLGDLQGKCEGTGHPQAETPPALPHPFPVPICYHSPACGGPATLSPSLTPVLDSSEPRCRSLRWSRSAVRAARTLLSELCTAGAGAGIRPSASPAGSVPPSCSHSPFWARAQKLRCRWA